AAQGRARRMAGPLVVLIWVRVARLAARFMASLARGPVPARPSRDRAGARREPAPRPGCDVALPRDFGWLRRLLPGDACSCAAAAVVQALVRDVISDPEVVAQIAINPALGRVLRPFCHLLGLKLPPVLQRPRRKREKPAAPRPRRPRPAVVFPPITSSPPPLGPGNHYFIPDRKIFKNR
ncbi:hypothetical protein, partial [Acidiphilium sp.]|uniref:hypothetical protein n=1 Tax=Acidiphilium sp. TaxID=527 RepID=UPI003D048CD6